MAPSLTLQQTKSIVQTADAYEYEIQFVVTAFVEMDENVFVINSTTTDFDHVATLPDITNYPDTITSGIAYYRANSAIQRFNNPESADAAALVVLGRLDELIDEYIAGGEAYDGAPVVVVLNGT